MKMIDRVKQKFSEFWDTTKRKFRKAVGNTAKWFIKQKTKVTHSDTLEYILDLELTPVFIFAASFLLTYEYALWERALFSLGLYQVTEYAVKNIMQIKVIG